jgi:sec-independent protein translocase protein TatB
MAAEFRASFDEMARQSELDELRAQVDALRKGQLEEIAALRADEAQVAEVFDEIGQGLHESARYETPAIHEYAEPASLPPGDAMPAAEPAPKPKAPRARAKPKAEPTVTPAKKAAKPRTKRTGTVT